MILPIGNDSLLSSNSFEILNVEVKLDLIRSVENNEYKKISNINFKLGYKASLKQCFCNKTDIKSL